MGEEVLQSFIELTLLQLFIKLTWQLVTYLELE